MGLFDFFTQSTEQTLKECRQHPSKCLAQLMLDGAVIVASYALLTYLLDGRSLQWDRVARFYGLFLFLAFVFRYLDVDFQEQLTRVAGFQLGTKLFLALGP